MTDEAIDGEETTEVVVNGVIEDLIDQVCTGTVTSI